MVDELLKLDRELFIWLNSLGSERYDGLWLLITQFTSWIPVFVFVLYFAFKRLGWRHALLVVGCIAVLLLLTDQTTNLIKNSFHRLRPSSNPELAHLMRAVQKRASFSFISGHSSNSMAVAFFSYHVLKPYLKYMGFFFLWPLIFAYSRIYLGLHYPSDIFCGFLWGLFTGWLMLKTYAYFRNRFFPQQKEGLDHPTNSEPVANG
jgi:undecaprenyl-diphosphatase